MKPPFLEQLNQTILLGDGAIGNELFARRAKLNQGFERLNILSPDLVQQLHSDYVAAGSVVIETNTFAANRLSLTRYGAEHQLRDIIFGGVTLARRAAGESVYVAGSVGPLPSHDADPISDSDRTAIFAEQISLLIENGVELLIFETFADLKEMVKAVSIARSMTGLPIVAQMAFDPDGLTASGDSAEDVASACKIAGADVVGANCGYGVPSIACAIRRMSSQDIPLSAYMNAGFPERVEGRLIYLSAPEYIAKRAKEIVSLGARLVGGCCGTNPKTIRTMANIIGLQKPFTAAIPHSIVSQCVQPLPEAESRPASVPRRILVELDPPSDLDVNKVINAAMSLKNTGVDAITIADNPLASVRVDTLTMAALLQRESGIPAIPHLTGRDRNRIALQSTIMGAHLLGIRSLLCVTGDPVRMHQEANTSGVFDVNSISLVRLVSDYNSGRRMGSTDQTSFAIGVAFNPNVRSFAGQISKLQRKIDAGANFVLTQPIFSTERLHMMQEALDEAKITIPIFVGVLPLTSAKNAEFLHNEVPGILIPDAIRDTLARYERVSDQRNAALEISLEFVTQISSQVKGFYLITPRNRVELVLPLVAAVVSIDRR